MAGFGDELLILRGPTGVTDQSSAGNNGTYNGGMGIVADTDAGGVSAFLTDGTDDYIGMGSVLVPATGNFTIGYWMYEVARSGFSTHFSQYGSDTGRSQIGSRNGTPELASGAFSSITGTSVALATWVFICLTRTGSTLELYQNGASQGTRTYAGTFGTTVQTAIGAGIRQPAGSDQFFSNARIDDVRILSRAISTTEISAWNTGQRGYDASTGAPAQNAQNNNLRNIRMSP